MGTTSAFDAEYDDDLSVKKKKYVEYTVEDLPDTVILTKEEFMNSNVDVEKFLQNYAKKKKNVAQKCALRRAKVIELVIVAFHHFCFFLLFFIF